MVKEKFDDKQILEDIFSNRKDNKMDSFMNYLNGLLNILSD